MAKEKLKTEKEWEEELLAKKLSKEAKETVEKRMAKAEREKISRSALGAAKRTISVAKSSIGVAKEAGHFIKAPGKIEKVKQEIKQAPSKALTMGMEAAKMGGRAAKTVALQGPGYAAAPYKAVVSEKGAGYVGEAAGTVVKGAMQPLKKGISIKVAFPKGVVHPDSLIHRKELYFTSNPQITPTGKFMTDWRDLYFIKKKSVPVEAQGVYGALQEGYTDVEQITVVTGLTPQQVSSGYNYLKRKNMLPENTEVE